jgi:hypothetical protein
MEMRKNENQITHLSGSVDHLLQLRVGEARVHLSVHLAQSKQLA